MLVFFWRCLARALAVSHFLAIRHIGSAQCCQCASHIENILHFQWSCFHTSHFWASLEGKHFSLSSIFYTRKTLLVLWIAPAVYINFDIFDLQMKFFGLFGGHETNICFGTLPLFLCLLSWLALSISIVVPDNGRQIIVSLRPFSTAFSVSGRDEVVMKYILFTACWSPIQQIVFTNENCVVHVHACVGERGLCIDFSQACCTHGFYLHHRNSWTVIRNMLIPHECIPTFMSWAVWGTPFNANIVCMVSS